MNGEKMTKLTNEYATTRQKPALTHLMNEVTSNDYQLGYFQDVYDLTYTHPDLAYQLEAKEWIALLEHAWKFVYRAAIEDNHLSDNERMDLNNIHKLRNFYSAQLRSGRKLQLHHDFIKPTFKVKELNYENKYEKTPELGLKLNFERKYEPQPEKSVNNVNSPYYVPKPWELDHRMVYKPDAR